jgi:VanZ family protein
MTSRRPSFLATLAHVTPAAAYCAVLFAFGSLPPGNDLAPDLNDKLLHALGFGFLVPLNLLAVAHVWRSWPPRLALVVAGVLAGAAGGLLEVHQLLFTQRSADVADWVADLVGVTVVAALWAGYQSFRSVPAPTSDP